ncbi:MAG: metallophosphoesterase family protein [Thermomicrobium sp.]|uniref:metallophosphoesterase family protein n=1 Tax=Thermomicrobium sp. TaxID=1969469 RepID=UPI001B0D749E|nr:metallophosphoesterase family protein [Thermomicrobium sp.]MBO9358793.1 metallophosphoesterase family protein [Thermomicrobium sp.]
MRVLVVSDIHGNLEALEAVLAAAGPVDRVWCLGDVVGYGPRPRECVERIWEVAGPATVLGNHDAACSGRLPLEGFNPAARYALRWTMLQLGTEHRAFLENLPEKLVLDEVTLVHGSLRAPIWEYVFTTEQARTNFRLLETRLCFFGHTHVPFLLSEEAAQRGERPLQPSDGMVIDTREGRLLVNPGSVGQPRDGDPRAAFLLWEPEAQRLTFRRVPYNIEAVQAEMAAARLPQLLIERLALGL